jgi:hypothetical protein
MLPIRISRWASAVPKAEERLAPVRSVVATMFAPAKIRNRSKAG